MVKLNVKRPVCWYLWVPVWPWCPVAPVGPAVAGWCPLGGGWVGRSMSSAALWLHLLSGPTQWQTPQSPGHPDVVLLPSRSQSHNLQRCTELSEGHVVPPAVTSSSSAASNRQSLWYYTFTSICSHQMTQNSSSFRNVPFQNPIPKMFL